jgi:hypothetical protein
MNLFAPCSWKIELLPQEEEIVDAPMLKLSFYRTQSFSQQTERGEDGGIRG